MLFDISRTLRHACYWLVDRYGDGLEIVASVERLKAPMQRVYKGANRIVVGTGKKRQRIAAAELAGKNVPEGLARKMAGLLLTRGALDIADLSVDYGTDVMDTARMYARLSERLGIVWLHRNTENLIVEGRWQAMARSNLRDEFYSARRDLAVRILQACRDTMPLDDYEDWMTAHEPAVRKYDGILAEMKLRGGADFATLSVAAQELRRLISN